MDLLQLWRNNSLCRNITILSWRLTYTLLLTCDVKLKKVLSVGNNGFRLLVSYDKDLDTNRPWNLKSIIQCYFYCERHVLPSWTACVRVSKYHIENKETRVTVLVTQVPEVPDWFRFSHRFIYSAQILCLLSKVPDSLQVYLITTTNMFHYEDNPGAPGLHCGFQGVDWFLILRSYCLCW